MCDFSPSGVRNTLWSCSASAEARAIRSRIANRRTIALPIAVTPTFPLRSSIRPSRLKSVARLP